MPEVESQKSENQEWFLRLTDSFTKISSLKNGDNIARRNLLKDIHNIIQSSKDCFAAHPTCISDLEALIQMLIRTLSNESEKCREISATTLTLIYGQIYVADSTFSNLFKVLAQRLGKTDEREKSEEIRLLEIDLMYTVVQKYSGDLLSYFNDISTVLSVCIVDDSPDVKRRSCECLSVLSSKHNNFHMIASNFLPSLLKTITHQHMKTRTLCVQAVGSIINFLRQEDFDQAVRHLSQRLFDRTPQVRLAVTTAIGNMLLSLDDRYSYFNHLIPLMLSALYDDVPDIRSKAQSLWRKAGDQYLKENEKDYKDLIDFPKPDPDNYPLPGQRPSLGCRILVHRNIYNILPPLLRDISDWVAETQSKSSQVLYSLILHSEEKVTIHLSTVLQGIESAAKSDENECVTQALNSAELLGFFTDPNLLFDSVLTLIHKSQSSANISILAACLKGCQKQLPANCYSELCKFLAGPTLCRIRQAPEQANMLLCVEALLCLGNLPEENSLHYLFIVLASISGLTTNDTVLKRANDLYIDLAKLQSSTKENIFKECALPFLKTLVENNKLWTPLSPEAPIFCYLIQAGYIDEGISELIIPALVNNLHPSKDAKLRSKILTLLIPVFKSVSQVTYEKLNKLIISVFHSGLFPNLQWSAGRTASSLRIVAVASLFEILNNCCFRKNLMKHIGEEILPILKTLTDEDAVSARLLACKTLELIFADLMENVDEHKIHNASYEIMHCMDDESDDVRLVMTRVLKSYINSFPANYNWKKYRSHLKHLYENVLIHMDDQNEKIKYGVLDLLKDAAFAAPDILRDELESKRYDMASEDMCNDLIEHIKTLKF